VYVWVCMYGVFNLWVCVCVGFVMCGCVCCVCAGLFMCMCGCVYVWVFNVWVCVCVGFVMFGCVYVCVL